MMRQKDREREERGKERRCEGHILDANSARVVVRCHCHLAGYTKKAVFCFSSAIR